MLCLNYSTRFSMLFAIAYLYFILLYFSSTDKHNKSYSMIVRLNISHNHLLESADALRHRDIAEHIKQKFRELFQSSHSPTSALETHKHDMQNEHKDQYVYVSADRAIVPDVSWCFRYVILNMCHYVFKEYVR